jgi:hypothetical protein
MLTQRRAGLAADGVEATWRVADGLRLRLMARSDAPFEVTTARSPGQPYADYQSALLFRAPGRARRFGTVLEAYGESSTVAAVRMDRGAGVTVKLTDGSERGYAFRMGR